MTERKSIVYVIDDDESVRKSFARLLRSADLACETFSSPEAFLSIVRQEKDACIVVDTRMSALAYLELTQRLIACGIRIPLLLVPACDGTRKPVDDQVPLDVIRWAISENDVGERASGPARSYRADEEADELPVIAAHLSGGLGTTV